MAKLHQGLVLLISVAVIAGAIFLIQNPFKSSSEGFTATIEPINKEANVGIDVSNRAPDFTLQDKNGNPRKLSDFGGKVVFLNFWASWCPFCIDEMPDIQNVANEFGGDVVVLFVNRGESRNVAQNYLERVLPVEITYPILYDEEEVVSRVYILVGMPVSYIIDKDGIIKDRKFGPLTEDEVREKLQAVV